jgi:pimeloyl-ACP methyl ester carboxylesterase
VNGRTVHYLIGGDPGAARTLVLLHAFPIGVTVWEQQLDAFPDWRVIAPALPGFDDSDSIEDVSVDGYAAHVLAFMDALGLDRACVGGLSLGGYILLAMVRRSPHKMSGVILADTRSSADSAEARGSRERMLTLVGNEGTGAVATDVIPKLLGATTLRERPAIVAAVRTRIEAQSGEAVAAAIRVMMSRPDATSVLATIQVPAAVVVGEEDTITPPAEVEHLHAAIPSSTFVRIPHAGHLSSIENPDAFNAALAAFLANVR